MMMIIIIYAKPRAVETVRYCCLHYKSPPIHDDTPRDKYLSHALVALTWYVAARRAISSINVRYERQMAR